MASDRRLHPLSFVFAIQDSARQFVLPAIVALFAARGRDSVEIWAAVVIVPLALIALARAWSVRYRLDPTELVIRSGFVFKRVRHIPYDRVHNVDAVQNPLHRLLDVIEVRVETGGGGEAEAALRVVDRGAFEEIRSLVFAARAGAEAGAESEAAPAPAANVLYRMSNRDLMIFGLIQGRGTIVAVALFGALWEFRIVDTSEALARAGIGRGLIRQVVGAFFGNGSFPVQQLLMALAALTLVLGVLRLASAFWTFLGYYGFHLSRAGDDLRCEYGLLTKVTSTIPVRRIQKITVRDGPWHRRGDYFSLRAQTAGGRAGEAETSSRTWLAPLIRRAELPPLLRAIAPEVAADADWQPVHPRGVRREFVGTLLFIVPICAAAIWIVGFRAAVLLPLGIGWAYLYASRSIAACRWALSPEAIHFASGWIWRTRVAAPLGKVQAVSRHESPFDRRHGMASVFTDTAGAGVGADPIRIPYLPASVASILAAQLAAGASRTTFRW